MVLVTSSKSRRLLHLIFIGDVQCEQLQATLPDVVDLLAEMSAGFRVLTDFSALDSMQPDCAPVIGQVMELCDQKGVGKVVRLIPDPARDIGMNILTLFHYHHRPMVATVATMKEAGSLLE